MSAVSVRASLAALIAVAALAACGTSPPAHPATTHHAPGTTPTALAIPAPAATHAAPTPAATHSAKPKHKKKHHKKPAAVAPVTQAPPATQAPPPVNPMPQGNGGDHDGDNNGGPDDGDGGTI